MGLIDNVAGLAGNTFQSSTTLILTAVVLYIGYFVVSDIRQWLKLRHIPGPFISSFTRFPLVKCAWNGRMSYDYHALQQKYGPLFRITPDTVMYGDADTMRVVNAVRGGFSKAWWYQGSKHLKDVHNLFSLTDEHERKVLREKLAKGYTYGKDTGLFERRVDNNIERWINLIERKYISTDTELRPMELAHKAQYFTIDVMTELNSSEASGYLEQDRDVDGFIEVNDKFVPWVPTMMAFPAVNNILRSWPFSTLLGSEGDEVGFGRMIGVTSKRIQKRLDALEKDKYAGRGDDMMQAFIDSGLTHDELLAEIMLEFPAGSDSTSNAIRLTILQLITNPSALTSLRSEIDTAVSLGQISSPITNAEAMRLPYLQAVIREGLRLYPPATGTMPKIVPKGGLTVHGYFVPEGTQMAVNIMHICRDKEVFGEDAHIFNPDRWIAAHREDKEGRYAKMCRTADLIFGNGKYECIGKHIAWLELNKVFVELLRRYDFAPIDASKPLKVHDFAFWLVEDFWLKVTRRRTVV
ncbi:cytochrome P450 [Sordaria brevicollis]|uniref:Cytochrome P450 n=1 Tax=Sordaria brevicollis TaxID=83679 RepID=A0AAE0NVK3_SORBR|nr:cytochrome P450 [Sordaria brevicollis]